MGDAFGYCSALTEMNIPNSVTDINSTAFRYCIGLTSIDVAGDNPAYKAVDGMLLSKDGTEFIACMAG